MDAIGKEKLGIARFLIEKIKEKETPEVFKAWLVKIVESGDHNEKIIRYVLEFFPELKDVQSMM